MYMRRRIHAYEEENIPPLQRGETGRG